MESDKFAFWGIALKPGEPADLELQDGETLHVTMASYGVNLVDPKGRSVVTATVHDSDQKHGLAVLNAGMTESRVMDITFIGEESITFEVSGKNIVHLVGNFSFDDDMEDDSDDSDEEGEALIGVYDDGQDMDSDDDDDDDENGPEPKLLTAADDPPVITEVTEEDETKDSLKKRDKKVKLPNGKQKVATTDDKVKEEKEVIKTQKKEAIKLSKKKDEKTVTLKAEVTEMKKKEEEEEEEEDEEEEEEEKEEGENEEKKKNVELKKMEVEKMEVEVKVDEKEEEEDEEEQMEGVAGERPDQNTTGSKGSSSLQDKDEKEEGDGDEDEEDEIKPDSNKPQATPKSSKKKGKKRRTAVQLEEPTPPVTKKSKISQRPGTPAAVKTVQKVPKGDSAQKPTKDDAGTSSVAKGAKQMSENGVGKDTSGNPAHDKAKGTGESPSTKSNKKKKRRSKRGGNMA